MDQIKELRKENEIAVSVSLMGLLKWIFIPIVISIVLNILGIFVLNFANVLMLAGMGLISLFLPYIYKKRWIKIETVKYILVIYATIFATLVYGVAFSNVLTFFIVPFAIALNYFDGKLLRFTLILSVPAFIAGEILATKNQLVQAAGYEWIPLHFCVHAVILIVLIALFRKVVVSATLMLEKNNQFITELKSTFSKIDHSSGDLKVYVSKVRREINELTKAVNDIGSAIEEIAEDTKELFEEMNKAVDKVDIIEGSIQSNRDLAQYIAQEIKTLVKNSLNSQKEILKSSEEVQEMGELIEITKNTIGELKAKSDYIQELIKAISYIANETNLLSLNASIEAAKAGELGRGFMVVAQEVKKLANESNESANNIKKIVGNIKVDTDTANGMVIKTYDTVNLALDLINNTMTVFDKTNTVQNNLEKQAVEIAEHSHQMSMVSKEVTQSIGSLLQRAKRNQEAILHIVSAIHQIESSSLSIEEHIQNINNQAMHLSDTERKEA